MRRPAAAPPGLSRWILERISHHEDRATALDDFDEIFEDILERDGIRRARSWYRSQVLRSIPMVLVNHLCWCGVMVNNYFKVAMRNIKRHRGYSFINIVGLAVGMTSCLLIALWILDELSYDRMHPEVDRIHQVVAHTDMRNTTTPVLLGPTLKEEFPEVVNATRYHWMFGNTILSHGDKSFNEKALRIVDPSFFEMFPFPFLRGDPKSAFTDPNSIVISEAVAEKYFSTGNPMGKILTLNREHELRVTGVLKTIPHNSTLQFDILIPMGFKISITRDWYTDWTNFFPYNFIQLSKTCSPDDLTQKISGLLPGYGGQKNARLDLIPFADRHFIFYSDKMYVYIFFTIAAFILVIACLNFINLATARSARRAGEIGMRKVVGARRGHIVSQFMGESMIFSFAAVILSVGLGYLLLPIFNSLTGKEIHLDPIFILPAALGLALFAGFAAGSYPALLLSSFKPISVLRKQSASGRRGGGLRKALVVTQFSISILLIFAMFIVGDQIGYIHGKDFGYDRQNLVGIALGGGSEQYYHRLKNELLRDTRILGVTGTGASLPYFGWHLPGFEWEGKDPNQKISISHNIVDYDFVKTMKMELIEGRDFSKEFASDANTSYLINEAMVKLMQTESAAGMTLTRGDQTGKIVGVVKNFHYSSFENPIEPITLRLEPDSVDNLLIRIQPGKTGDALAFIDKTWRETVKGFPFTFGFLDDDFARGYQNLQRTGRILNSFALLAIFISCLGLFGLVSFMVEERTKEIGIRKVMGAPVIGIIRLLIKDFSRCIVWAAAIAWPLGFLVMNRWLHHFAYRTGIGIFPILLSGLIALVFALSIAGLKSIQAALANPVDSLRYE